MLVGPETSPAARRSRHPTVSPRRPETRRSDHAEADSDRVCLDAGLLDEIHIDLAAVLLGAGVRLLDHLADTPAVLGNPTVVAGVGVTHLRYPVQRA